VVLTPEELEGLTGRHTKPAQRRQLTAMGISFAIRADGSIAVSKAHAEQVLGGQIGEAPAGKKRTKFVANWGALDAA